MAPKQVFFFYQMGPFWGLKLAKTRPGANLLLERFGTSIFIIFDLNFHHLLGLE